MVTEQPSPTPRTQAGQMLGTRIYGLFGVYIDSDILAIEAEAAALADSATGPDHDCLMESACGVSGFYCSNSRSATGALDVEVLAKVYTRVRGAHTSNGTNWPDDEPDAPPCDWCRLAAAQHIEAAAEYARLEAVK